MATHVHISTLFLAAPDGTVSVKKKEEPRRQQDQSKQTYLLEISLRNHKKSRWLIHFLMVGYTEGIVRSKQFPQSTKYLSAYIVSFTQFNRIDPNLSDSQFFSRQPSYIPAHV